MTEPLERRPFDAEKLFDEACKLCNDRLLVPGDHGYAVAGHDQGPSGTPFVLWFDTQHDALQFIATYMVAFCGAYVDSHETIFDEVWELCNATAIGDISDEEALPKMNQIAKPSFKIQWWGTREDLLKSNAPFPQELRALWRELGEYPKGIPVSETEEVHFLRFLENDYGI